MNIITVRACLGTSTPEFLFMVWGHWPPKLPRISYMKAKGWHIFNLDLYPLPMRLWVRTKRQTQPGMVQ